MSESAGRPTITFSSAQDPLSWEPNVKREGIVLTFLTNGDAKLGEKIFNDLLKRAEAAERELADCREKLAECRWVLERLLDGGAHIQIRYINQVSNMIDRLAAHAERKGEHMKVTDEMVDRFLSWPLPESVCADLIATKQGPGRIGTNLLTANEAKMMLEHVLAPSPAGPDALAEVLHDLSIVRAVLVERGDMHKLAERVDRVITRLRSRPAQGDSRDAEAALRELVELKNLKDRDVVFNGDAYQDYALRKPLAWAKAREVIASLDAAVSQQEQK